MQDVVIQDLSSIVNKLNEKYSRKLVFSIDYQEKNRKMGIIYINNAEKEAKSYVIEIKPYYVIRNVKDSSREFEIKTEKGNYKRFYSINRNLTQYEETVKEHVSDLEKFLFQNIEELPDLFYKISETDDKATKIIIKRIIAQHTIKKTRKV